MLSKDKVVEFLTKTDRKKGRNAQIHTRGMLSTFEEYLQRKTSVYILKPFLEIGQSFEKSLRGDKLVIRT